MKNIVLIGGSYGIGNSIAQEMKAQHNVWVACRTAIEETANLKHIPFDVTSEVIDVSVFPEIIDGFVFLPGSINLRPFRGIKPEVFASDMQLNFFDMVKILQLLLPNLQKSTQASLVLFSSVAATIGMPFHTSVAASKGAVEGFAKALAAEYAPKIRVNVIAPSLTQTPLADKFLNNEVKQEKSAERHPLKRFGQPEDLAAMTAFLLSDKSSWISGQIFHIDGGMSTLQTH